MLQHRTKDGSINLPECLRLKRKRRDDITAEIEEMILQCVNEADKESSKQRNGCAVGASSSSAKRRGQMPMKLGPDNELVASSSDKG